MFFFFLFMSALWTLCKHCTFCSSPFLCVFVKALVKKKKEYEMYECLLSRLEGSKFFEGKVEDVEGKRKYKSGGGGEEEE